MSRFILMFFTVLLPGLALAKRAAPAKVEPVIHQGVRYIAPNDDGRRAYIEAWDVQTNKKLWDLTVFTNRIDTKLEEDVQWVFIKTLGVRDGTLIVTSERGETYRVDLKTKAVTQSEFAALSLTASLESLPALSSVGSFYRLPVPSERHRTLRPRLPSSTTSFPNTFPPLTAGRRSAIFQRTSTFQPAPMLALIRSFPIRLPFGLDVYVAVPQIAPFASRT